MTRLGYLLFMAGQVGIMMLIRFFLQWINYFASTQPDESALSLWLKSFLGAELIQAPGASVPLVPLAGVGLMLLCFRIFDGVTDPIAGVVSEAWVKRGRERRRLLLYWFFVPVVGLLIVFSVNHSMGMLERWWLLGVGMLILFVGYTFYGIPYWSLMSDYAHGNERTSQNLSTLLGLGLLIATAIGFVVSPVLVERLGFFRAALCIALPALVLMMMPYFAAPKTKSRHSVWAGNEPLENSRDVVISALKDRQFMALVVMCAGSHMSFTVMTSAAPFLAVHLLDGSESDVAKLLGPLLVVAIPCFAFVPRVSARLGWEKSLAFASLALGVVYASTAALGYSVFGSPMQTAMLLFAFGGPMVALVLGVESEAVAACAQRRERPVVSVYFGVFNFVVKAMNGVAIFVAGVLAGLGGMGELGRWAYRSMSLVAGLFLIFGVVGYYVVRPAPQPGTEA